MIEYCWAPWEVKWEVICAADQLRGSAGALGGVHLCRGAARSGGRGHFPRRRKAAAFGTIVLFGSMALVLVSWSRSAASQRRCISFPGTRPLSAANSHCSRRRWRCAGFRHRFVDARGAPLVFAGASTVFALLLIWLVVDHRCVAVDATAKLESGSRNARLQRGGCLP